MALLVCPCPQLRCHHGPQRSVRAGRARHGVPRASPIPVPRGRCFPERLEPQVPPGTRTLPGPRHPPGSPAQPQGSSSPSPRVCSCRMSPPAWGKAGRGSRAVCARHGAALAIPRGWGRPRAPSARAEPARGWALTYRCSGAEPVGAPRESGGSVGRDRALGWAGLKAAGTPRLSHRSAPLHPRGPRRRTHRVGRRPSAGRG